jgi:hypothetical protein
VIQFYFQISVILGTAQIKNVFTSFNVAILGDFLAANTECSAGSNDHFVVGRGVPSLVQFDGRPLGGANFQY